MAVHRIIFEGTSLEAKSGERLRDALLRNGRSPHNGGARMANCHGLGTCGTCAVAITGPVSPMTAVERWRLGFPPHRGPDCGLRLACQARVEGDLKVAKHPGFWGQHLDQDPR